jgi:hypothetical protein
MSKIKNPTVAIITHTLALVAGWAIYEMLSTKPDETTSHSGNFGPTRVTTRASASEAGKEILTKVLARTDRGAEKAYLQTDESEIHPDLLARIDSIEVPDDIHATLDKLVAERSKFGGENRQLDIEIMALCFHATIKDASAHFKWAKQQENQIPGVLTATGACFSELHKRLGTEGIKEIIKQNKYPEKGPFEDFLIKALAKARDPIGMLEVKELMSEEQWQANMHIIGESWPESDAASLIKLAVDTDDPQMLAAYGIRGTRGSFLAKLLRDESLPEDFRRRLGENQMARQALTNDPAVPLEIRIANGGNSNLLIVGDVERLLDSERDWSFAFRHGEANALEIYEMIVAKTPELAAERPVALRNQVFRELAEENPKAAMKMLDDLPEHERNDLALFTARANFQDVDPKLFLELLEQVPADTPAEWEGRLDAWNRRSLTNNQRLKDSYSEWVLNLPPGIDREMAIYSLIRTVGGSDSRLGAPLKVHLSDTELQRRLSLNQ